MWLQDTSEDQTSPQTLYSQRAMKSRQADSRHGIRNNNMPRPRASIETVVESDRKKQTNYYADVPLPGTPE